MSHHPRSCQLPFEAILTTMHRAFSRPSAFTLLRAAAYIASACLLIALLAAFASSRLPMRAAAVFGILVQGIKDNPAFTAVICCSAVAAAWLTIAIIIAVQECRPARRR